MNFIRRAQEKDISRIAEILVVNYRTNFYAFFHNDEYYFGELNVIGTAKTFAESGILNRTFVFDDGIVKGFVSINGAEIEKLYVEPMFQNQKIGTALLRFAVDEKNADFLWALEYNSRGIQFYNRNGFFLTSEKMIQDEFVPLVKLAKKNR